jgi:hypothetical protein
MVRIRIPSEGAPSVWLSSGGGLRFEMWDDGFRASGPYQLIGGFRGEGGVEALALRGTGLSS